MLLLSKLTNTRPITLHATKKIIDTIPKRYIKNLRGDPMREKHPEGKSETLDDRHQRFLIEIREEIIADWCLDYSAETISFSDLGYWLMDELGVTLGEVFDEDSRIRRFDFKFEKPVFEIYFFKDLVRGILAQEIYENFIKNELKTFAFCPICNGLYNKIIKKKKFCSRQCRKANNKRKVSNSSKTWI